MQTQFCFDLGLLRRYLAALSGHGILEQVFVIAESGLLAHRDLARAGRAQGI